MLSGIVIVKNEEKQIIACIKSLSFCDEIIVVDNSSTDNTKTLVLAQGVKYLSSDIIGDFAALRNIGAQEAKGEWLLYIDADERISDALRANIKHELYTPSCSSYFLKRRDHFMGRTLENGEVSKVFHTGLVRLMKKGTGSWEGKIHEKWKTDEPIGELDGFIEHYPHQTLHEFLEHINRYSTYRAAELSTKRMKTNIFELVFYPLGKFVYTYFVKRGYMDGAAGFVYSFIMSFHSFLVRAKLYMSSN